MSSTGIYVISRVSPCQLADCLARQRNDTKTIQPHFFHTCHAYRYHRTLPVYNSFSDLDVCWWSRGELKANPLGCIFSHTLQLIRMKLDMMLKQFTLTFLILLLGAVYWKRRNDCCFNDCVQKFNVCVHSNLYLLQTCDSRCYWTLHFDTV